MSAEQGELFFSAAARLLQQLGRELIADRTTALAELIKNGYDADATEVVVRFLDPAKGGVLEVRDDGTGMSLSNVHGRWMRLSTSYKERMPRSPRYRRARGGKKGIGRFACEALGRRLVLTSSREGEPTRVVVHFDWDAFERQGTVLEEVPCRYRVEAAAPEDHGTTLRIEALREEWGEPQLEKVRRAILLLQPPFPVRPVYDDQEADPGFRVELRIGDAGTPDKGLGRLADETKGFLSAATAVVEAWVDQPGGGGGEGQWTLRSDILGLDETQTYPEPVLTVGPFSLKAWYFIPKRDAIGDLTVPAAKGMGKAHGGIRIYRDGLRVPPYGDKGDDWLGLDELARQRSFLPPVANSNWFGYVSLSRDDNVLLTDTTSREGVLRNDAFEELRHFTLDVLRKTAGRVAAARGKKETATKRATKLAPTPRVELVERALGLASQAVEEAKTGAHDAAGQLLVEVEQLAMEARIADRAQTRDRKSLLDELALMRILASLGTSIVVFGHEVRGALNAVGGRLVNVEEEVRDGPEPWRTCVLDTVSDARTSFGRLHDLAGFIEGYASRGVLREKAPLALTAVLEEFAAGMGALALRRSAYLEVRVEPPHLRTAPMGRTELDAILVNFLTNALKAFEGSRNPERRVSMFAGRDGDFVVLRVEDTGRGIPSDVRDKIFEPFVSKTLARDAELGAGTGLGLKIVKDMVEANSGTVDVGEPSPGFTTCLEVRLPAWRGQEKSDG